MQNNQYLTIKEVAEILDVTDRAVQKWVQDGRLKSYKVGGNYRIRPQDLLDYLENLGNPPFAMKEFNHDIYFYLTEKAMDEAKSPEEIKALLEKDPKMFDDVMMNTKKHLPGSIVGYEKGKNDDPYKSNPFKDFEESKEAEKYLSEAETPEEKAKRFAEVKNYKEGKCSKPWGKQ